MNRIARILFLLLPGPALAADGPAPEIRVIVADLPFNAGFRLPGIPVPVAGDAGTKARWTLLTGTLDANGAGLGALHDDRLPANEDDPRANGFFTAGGEGGAIHVELESPSDLAGIRTYSWHSGGRAPQAYRLYAAKGNEEGFTTAAAAAADPVKHGWTLLAEVDTHSGFRHEGGQHAASVTAATGATLGTWRHLLFVIEPVHRRDAYGHTFFSEIDLVAAAPEPLPELSTEERVVLESRSDDGSLRVVVDATRASDFAGWSRSKLLPLVSEWYPKVVALLPGEGFEPHDTVLLEFRDDLEPGIPAAATGNRIRMNTAWFRGQLEGEAAGCIVHELVHVVQQYDRARARNPLAATVPGWITEGIADYVRWFRFEPSSGGAVIPPERAAGVAPEGSYRISANFLDWTIRRHDDGLLAKLNEAARQGRYRAELWNEWTGSDLGSLGAAWKAQLAKGTR